MTTDLSEAQAKAIRLIEEQIEAVGFDIDANSRQTAGLPRTPHGTGGNRLRMRKENRHVPAA